jgi:hypothetical protein
MIGFQLGKWGTVWHVVIGAHASTYCGEHHIDFCDEADIEREQVAQLDICRLCLLWVQRAVCMYPPTSVPDCANPACDFTDCIRDNSPCGKVAE